MDIMKRNLLTQNLKKEINKKNQPKLSDKKYHF